MNELNILNIRMRSKLDNFHLLFNCQLFGWFNFDMSCRQIISLINGCYNLSIRIWFKHNFFIEMVEFIFIFNSFESLQLEKGSLYIKIYDKQEKIVYILHVYANFLAFQLFITKIIIIKVEVANIKTFLSK